MTQRYRDSLKPYVPAYVPKVGVYHQLDDSPTDRNERSANDGSIKKGIAGVFDVRRGYYIESLNKEIDWHMANPDRPTSSSPMRQPLDPADVCETAGLTDAQRQAMVMFLKGDSLSLIAEELGISVGAVQSRLNWGRLKLKIHFGDLGLDIPPRLAVG
jgi:DNA-binding CsgD family transcriptional regulator